jgi:hypothetical protein
MKEDTGLISKAEANYRKDAEGDSPCSSCSNYISPDSCKVVEGTISATGTSDLYASAENAASATANPEELMNMLFGGGGDGSV